MWPLNGPRRSHHADAVVTGAGSGIGAAFAKELSKRGSRVVCSDIDSVAAKRVARARFGGAGKLSSGRRPQANPGQAGVNYALALYVRRCLDNILPECPK